MAPCTPTYRCSMHRKGRSQSRSPYEVLTEVTGLGFRHHRANEVLDRLAEAGYSVVPTEALASATNHMLASPADLYASEERALAVLVDVLSVKRKGEADV